MMILVLLGEDRKTIRLSVNGTISSILHPDLFLGDLSSCVLASLDILAK